MPATALSCHRINLSLASDASSHSTRSISDVSDRFAYQMVWCCVALLVQLPEAMAAYKEALLFSRIQKPNKHGTTTATANGNAEGLLMMDLDDEQSKSQSQQQEEEDEEAALLSQRVRLTEPANELLWVWRQLPGTATVSISPYTPACAFHKMQTIRCALHIASMPFSNSCCCRCS